MHVLIFGKKALEFIRLHTVSNTGLNSCLLMEDRKKNTEMGFDEEKLVVSQGKPPLNIYNILNSAKKNILVLCAISILHTTTFFLTTI